MTFLDTKSKKLSGFYSHAKFVSWDEKVVEVGFPKQFSFGREPEDVAAVKAALREYARTPLEMRVTTIEEGQSVADAEGQRRREEHDKRVEEARAHPATQAVIDTFGAAIKEIKVDG